MSGDYSHYISFAVLVLSLGLALFSFSHLYVSVNTISINLPDTPSKSTHPVNRKNFSPFYLEEHWEEKQAECDNVGLDFSVPGFTLSENIRYDYNNILLSFHLDQSLSNLEGEQRRKKQYDTGYQSTKAHVKKPSQKGLLFYTSTSKKSHGEGPLKKDITLKPKRSQTQQHQIRAINPLDFIQPPVQPMIDDPEIENVIHPPQAVPPILHPSIQLTVFEVRNLMRMPSCAMFKLDNRRANELSKFLSFALNNLKYTCVFLDCSIENIPRILLKLGNRYEIEKKGLKLIKRQLYERLRKANSLEKELLKTTTSNRNDILTLESSIYTTNTILDKTLKKKCTEIRRVLNKTKHYIEDCEKQLDTHISYPIEEQNELFYFKRNKPASQVLEKEIFETEAVIKTLEQKFIQNWEIFQPSIFKQVMLLYKETDKFINQSNDRDDTRMQEFSQCKAEISEKFTQRFLMLHFVFPTNESALEEYVAKYLLRHLSLPKRKSRLSEFLDLIQLGTNMKIVSLCPILRETLGRLILKKTELHTRLQNREAKDAELKRFEKTLATKENMLESLRKDALAFESTTLPQIDRARKREKKLQQKFDCVTYLRQKTAEFPLSKEDFNHILIRFQVKFDKYFVQSMMSELEELESDKRKLSELQKQSELHEENLARVNHYKKKLDLKICEVKQKESSLSFVYRKNLTSFTEKRAKWKTQLRFWIKQFQRLSRFQPLVADCLRLCDIDIPSEKYFSLRETVCKRIQDMEDALLPDGNLSSLSTLYSNWRMRHRDFPHTCSLGPIRLRSRLTSEEIDRPWSY